MSLAEAAAMLDAIRRRVEEWDEAERAREVGPPPICGIVCHCGPGGEPLACGFPTGHAGAHAWATLPTFAVAETVPRG